MMNILLLPFKIVILVFVCVGAGGGAFSWQPESLTF